MGGMGRLGKIMLSIVLVFAATAILSALLSMASVYIINPTKGMNEQALENILQASEEDISEDAKKLSLPINWLKP